MTFAELVDELQDRGFSDLTGEAAEKRLKRWINQAYREITDAFSWPFLEATKEGTAPLTIADLAHVLSVTDATNNVPLNPADRRAIVRVDPDIESTGTANRWYMEGEETLKVWPVDTTSTYKVRYLKEPAELSEDADKPIIPEPYQDLIVDGAAVRAYKSRDNYEAGQFVRAEWERGMAQMRHALLKRNYDHPLTIQRTGLWIDYFG